MLEIKKIAGKPVSRREIESLTCFDISFHSARTIYRITGVKIYDCITIKDVGKYLDKNKDFIWIGDNLVNLKLVESVEIKISQISK
jgi:hypothetical protein